MFKIHYQPPRTPKAPRNKEVIIIGLGVFIIHSSFFIDEVMDVYYV